MARGPATVAATIHFTTTRFPDGALDGGPDQPEAAMHGGNCQKKQAPGNSRDAGIAAAVMSTTILMIHKLILVAQALMPAASRLIGTLFGARPAGVPMSRDAAE